MDSRSNSTVTSIAAALLTCGVLAFPVLRSADTVLAQAAKPAPQSSTAKAPADRGSELFRTTCRVCHGEAGIGGVGPALRGAKFTRPYVRRAMSEGRPGSMMPEFTKTFTTAQMNEVAGYVVSLQAPANTDSPGSLRGDPAAGETVFFSRGARSCYVCHNVGGRGGSVGPELMSKVASLTPRDLFQRIIVVPHRSTDPAYGTTRLTTRVGMILTGIKAGETEDAVRLYGELRKRVGNSLGVRAYSIHTLDHDRELRRALMQRAIELMAEGHLRPPPPTVLPLAEARRAHEMMEAGRTLGKIVLEP